MTTAVSTRTLSRTTGRYVRATPGSQSLARGLALLRAFRPGIGVLTNADLASRTGLPRPTVSRLTHSLVDAGFLDYDHVQRGYRLTVVYLSLALSYRTSQIALDLALPLMRTLAEVRRLNVGLAVLDDAEMVYLDSVRLSRLGVFRRMVPGSRIPVATTALGRACLSAMESGDQARVMDALAEQEGLRLPSVKAEIEAAFRSIETNGYCIAFWQEGIVAIAAPVRDPAGAIYSLNISMQASDFPEPEAVQNCAQLLKNLAVAIEQRWREAMPLSLAGGSS